MHDNKDTTKPHENRSISGVAPKHPPHRFSVAPMLDRTDLHCRYFHRLLTKQTLLYTEMVTTSAIIHGKADYLAYHEQEHPLALQLGGCCPRSLAQCAALAQQRGYDEINLNVGCPSDRVQNGRFGACLMADAALVADGIKAMRDRVSIPVTVKTRLGIDDQDSDPFLCEFVQTVAQRGGCNRFIIHARKAWLSGLSPKENREVPPLDYERVWQLKKDFPELTVVINGGINTMADARLHLEQVDGVMMGRAAWQNPAVLAQVDRELFDAQAEVADRITVMESFCRYIDTALAAGASLGQIMRPVLGLFSGLPGARQWRRYLSEQAHKPGAGVAVVEQALLRVIQAAEEKEEKN